MTWDFCTSGSAIIKAGKNVNSTIAASGSTLADYSDETQNIICTISKVDLITAYSTLTTNGKQILTNLAGSMIAQMMIGYDPSGYTNQREMETILDILENNIKKNTKLIEDDKIRTYLGAT